MNKLTRISATVASTVALVAGFAGVAGAAPSVGVTGYGSSNRVTHSDYVATHVLNNNSVHATNNNPQTAHTGSVSADANTTVGGGYGHNWGGNGGQDWGGDTDGVDSLASGSAMNDGMNHAAVMIDNSDSGDAAWAGAGSDMGGTDDAVINTTGAESLNTISYETDVHTTVTNNNSVTLTNNNSQTATTGSVSADRNTSVGSVRSGDASNVSTNVLEVSIQN